MFNFTTTNIVNTPGTFGVIDAAGDFLTTPAEAAAAVDITGFRLNYGPEFRAKDLEHGGISAIYVNKASRAEFAQARVSLAGLDPDAVYRIQIYIRVTGSAESTYSNDWVYKGKPLSLGEFPGGSTPADVIALVKKHQLALYGENLIDVTAQGTNLIITARSQHQRFINQDGNTGVELQKYTESVSPSAVEPGSFVVVPGAVTMITTGKAAFGDFSHIIRDLRLPSEANTRWYGIANGDLANGEPNEDRPNPGSYYTQITVVYDRNRGLGNGDVVGGLARSRTQHVFYVLDTPAANITTGNTAAGKVAAGSVAESFLNLLKLAAPDITEEYVEVPTSVL